MLSSVEASPQQQMIPFLGGRKMKDQIENDTYSWLDKSAQLASFLQKRESKSNLRFPLPLDVYRNNVQIYLNKLDDSKNWRHRNNIGFERHFGTRSLNLSSARSSFRDMKLSQSNNNGYDVRNFTHFTPPPIYTHQQPTYKQEQSVQTGEVDPNMEEIRKMFTELSARQHNNETPKHRDAKHRSRDKRHRRRSSKKRRHRSKHRSSSSSSSSSSASSTSDSSVSSLNLDELRYHPSPRPSSNRSKSSLLHKRRRQFIANGSGRTPRQTLLTEQRAEAALERRKAYDENIRLSLSGRSTQASSRSRASTNLADRPPWRHIGVPAVRPIDKNESYMADWWKAKLAQEHRQRHSAVKHHQGVQTYNNRSELATNIVNRLRSASHPFEHQGSTNAELDTIRDLVKQNTKLLDYVEPPPNRSNGFVRPPAAVAPQHSNRFPQQPWHQTTPLDRNVIRAKQMVNDEIKALARGQPTPNATWNANATTTLPQLNGEGAYIRHTTPGGVAYFTPLNQHGNFVKHRERVADAHIRKRQQQQFQQDMYRSAYNPLAINDHNFANTIQTQT